MPDISIPGRKAGKDTCWLFWRAAASPRMGLEGPKAEASASFPFHFETASSANDFGHTATAKGVKDKSSPKSPWQSLYLHWKLHFMDSHPCCGENALVCRVFISMLGSWSEDTALAHNVMPLTTMMNVIDETIAQRSIWTIEGYSLNSSKQVRILHFEHTLEQSLYGRMEEHP